MRPKLLGKAESETDATVLGGAIPDAALTPAVIARAVRAGRATPSAAAEALARALYFGRGADFALPGDVLSEPPPPKYSSWADWCGGVSLAQKRRQCGRTAKRANRPRLLSGSPATLLSPWDVWAVLAAALGRCIYCGSLAVEGRPSGPRGEPVRWAAVGRRIGSLGHSVPRVSGGSNAFANLAWCCLWCNTWRTERKPRAADHGGFYPTEPSGSIEWEAPYTPEYIARLVERAKVRDPGGEEDGELGPHLEAAPTSSSGGAAN
jgi:hypothetical protein